MDFLTFGLQQTCTHWAKIGVNGFNEPIFSEPQEIPCRWENSIERIQNDEGVEVVARARVFLDRQIKAGDYLAFGSLDGLDPRHVPGAWKVQSERTTPSLDGLHAEYKVFL